MYRAEKCRKKLHEAGVPPEVASQFMRAHKKLMSSGLRSTPEAHIAPLSHVRPYESIPNPSRDDVRRILPQAIVLKLNGGLGTSMDLDSPKGLLHVKEGLTFLDIAIKQVEQMEHRYGTDIRFMLMNSYRTSAETMEYLDTHHTGKFPAVNELMQYKYPRIDAETFEPIDIDGRDDLSWSPGGHGDFFEALVYSGKLHRLVESGYKYLFVSSIDNCNAVLDASILCDFASSSDPVRMEVCRREPDDRKGGHLAYRRKDQRIILRERSQCPPEECSEFDNITRHIFFNTNNIWLNLEILDRLYQSGRPIHLPYIHTRRSLCLGNGRTAAVIQMEKVIGSVISVFSRVEYVLAVPRGRFLPVKHWADLVAIRSDRYRLDPSDYRLIEVAGNDAHGNGSRTLNECRLVLP